MSQQDDDEKLFYDQIRFLSVDIANAEMASIGMHLHWDARVRDEYARQIAAMSKEIAGKAKSGAITWTEAAKKTQETRNIMALANSECNRVTGARAAANPLPLPNSATAHMSQWKPVNLWAMEKQHGI